VIWTLQKFGLAKKVYTAKIEAKQSTESSIVGRTLTPEVQRDLAAVEM
jgi:hypothetical protein